MYEEKNWHMPQDRKDAIFMNPCDFDPTLCTKREIAKRGTNQKLYDNFSLEKGGNLFDGEGLIFFFSQKWHVDTKVAFIFFLSPV